MLDQAIEKNSVDKINLKEKVFELEDVLFQQKRGLIYRILIEAIERPLLERVLERTEGNQLEAAKILGINRNTMRTKIRKLGINPQRWKI